MSSTGRRPSAWSSATARADVGLTGSRSSSTARAVPSHAATTVVAPVSSACPTAARTSSGTRTPRSSSHVSRPTTTRRALSARAAVVPVPRPECAARTRPSTPPPAVATNSETSSAPLSSELSGPGPGIPTREPDNSRDAAAAAATACAIGCSLKASTAPAYRSASSASTPSAGVTRSSRMRPSVTVPVLSSTTVSMRRVDSRISGPLMSTPSWAPRPVPTSRAVGVARPSAHGQAMMSTATAAVNANCVLAPARSQPTRVSAAMPKATGTNTAEIRSASRCTGALPVCAWATSRPIWASVVSEPTRVARTSRCPDVLTVAPVTASPGPTSTGTGSPVRSDVSTAEVPESTTPSVATFSPGRTVNTSPRRSSATGTREVTRPPSGPVSGVPSGPTATRSASLAPSSSSERSASPARRFERCSA
ncbi:hypothetical protein L600_000900000870 [Isoptericola variabilis J7]|nr:hypothetical protein L600_000900000870 [Isoptericola variabilis J7]